MRIFLIFLLFLKTINCFTQQRYAVSVPNLNGDYGKEYALDTINFKAYVVSQQSGIWKIYSIDLNNGVSSDLNIQTNGEINSLFYRNDSLYFGGNFTSVNGNTVSYKFFATYNTKTNSLLPGMNPLLNGAVTAIYIHENRLVLGGQFTSVLSSPNKKIVFLKVNSSSLIINNAFYKSDLITYLNNNPGVITNFKSRDVHLYFILDKKNLYGFTPFSTIYANVYHYSCLDNYSNEDAIYDYTFVNNDAYVVGNLPLNSTGLDINTITSNPFQQTASPNAVHDKVTMFHIYSGGLYNSSTYISSLFDASPNGYSNTVNNGLLFGCTGINNKYNRLNLVLCRSNYPSANRNSIIKTNVTNPINYIVHNYYAEISNLAGTVAYSQYNTLHNLKFFSNILTMFSAHADRHNSSYFPMAIKNDSIYIIRDQNAVIAGFVNNYGSICRGDTVKFKLKKQGNLKQYQWFYSGNGATIISANADSAMFRFNYNASVGQLKIVAKDNFNLPTDTFRYNITFKPLPNVSAGADKYITCKSSTVKLKATTNIVNYNFDWITPNGFTTLDSLNFVSTTGTYIVRIKDNITSCYNFDTLSVGIDTIKPNLYFPVSNNYTLTCKKQITTLAVNSISSTDSIKWAGQPYALNEANQSFSIPGKYYVQCYSNNNGCVKKDSVTIIQNITLPSYTFTPAFTSITCLRDSILLQTTVSNTNTLVYWKSLAIGNFLTDSVFGNIYADSAIAYNATIIDTVTGCKTLNAFIVKDSTLKPYAVLPANTQTITCSQNAISLVGSSPSPNTSFQWLGPAGYTSVNPAIVSLAGTYTFVVTDNANGCKKTDTLRVNKQNILLLQSSNDTTICLGSTITITSVPIGGTSPYQYNWVMGGAGSTILVSPSATTKYALLVTDANGCVGNDTVKVSVSPVLTDSTITFQPCDPNNPNGQIQVYARGGTPPYQFSLNAGPYQFTNVFANLPFGTYNFSIKDAIGCIKNGITQITNTSLAPQNDFLVSTKSYQTDTFVVVDISNPKPDSIKWSFPTTFTVINITNPYAPVVTCADTGYYNVSQTAYFGSCAVVLTKQVFIKYNDGSYATPNNNNGIQNINLSPNPNNGQFNLDVTMYKKQTFVIFVTDAAGVEKLRIPVIDANTFTGNIAVPLVTNGTYILKVVSSYDARHVVFIVSQ